MKRWMRYWKTLALAFLLLLCFGVLGLYGYMQGLGDVRTEYAKTDGPSPTAQAAGERFVLAALRR